MINQVLFHSLSMTNQEISKIYWDILVEQWWWWHSDMPRAGFEPAQNLSSGLVEWSCAVVITATLRCHNATIYDSKKFLTRASSIEDLLSFFDNLKLIKINDILRVLLWNYCCTASQIGYLLLFASLIQLPKMCCHLHNLKNLIYLL